MEIKDLNDKIDQVMTAQKSFQTELKAGNETAAQKASDDITALTNDVREMKTAMARSKVEDTFANETELKASANDLLRDAFRTGSVSEEKAAVLNTVTDSEGGYIVPPSLESFVVDLIRESSPARQYLNTMSMNSADYNFNMQATHATASWAGELDARTATGSPEFKRGKISAHDLYAYTELSDVMVEDSMFDIQSYVNGDVAKQFATAENIAFVNGDGSDKPTGLASFVDATVASTTTALAAITADAQKIKAYDIDTSAITDTAILDLLFDLNPMYVQNAVLVCGRQVVHQLRSLKDTQGRYLMHTDSQLLAQGMIGEIFGIKIIQDEQVATTHTSGDIAAYFGDMKGYTIFDRQGTTSQSDFGILRPGFKKLYTRKRVGGGLINGQGMRALRMV